MITGIFAKETVVGTINALYTQLDKTEKSDEDFDFASGIKESFLAIPKGFKKLGSTIFDPMGVKIDTANQEEIAGEMDLSENTFAEMERRFKHKNNAFAYLLFVLIYMPCVAVVAITRKEAGTRWAVFSVAYLTILAWIISTLFYQISIFASQPAISSVWIAVCVVISAVFYGLLKHHTK